MSFLDQLVSGTRARVRSQRSLVPVEELEERAARAPVVRPFSEALRAEEPAVIAEIKRATPSAGDIAPTLDAASTARSFRDGGASALSVLTEPDHFKGSLEDLPAARSAGLPVLRKDFVLDPYQVIEARAWSADAVLLIVRILGDELRSLIEAAARWGMDVLVEVFDESDVERALEAGALLVGINHRDLETFEVDPQRTAKLAPLLGGDVTVVALSGVSSRAEVEELAAAGAHAVLVGTSLVTAADPAGKLRELLGR